MAQSITLQNLADTAIVNNDILGQICFAAPNEAGGTDSILISASIFARSEGTFAADNNATELVFATATSESAAPGATNYDMTLSSAGNLTVAGDLTIDGDDLFMGTNTSGYVLVADGTNYNPVAISGHVTINSAGVVTLQPSVISGQTEITSADADYLLVWDDTDSALKKVDAGEFRAGTTYSAGDGLDLSSTTFSTDLKSNGGLVIESTELAMDLGASSITGTLAVGDGGTGATTLNNLITLGTHTTGNYVATLTGGDGITSTGATTGETIAHSISLDLKDNGGAVIESTELAIDLGASSITGTLAAGDGGTGLTSISTLLNSNTEGTALKSTGEGGGSKFLREDGDGTSSWQAVPDTTVAGDSGSTGMTPGDTLTIAGGTNITTAMSGDTLTITSSAGGLTQEQVEDYAGALVATGGTKTRITVSYQDSTGDMDFVVDDDLDNYDNSTAQFITLSEIPDSRTEVQIIDKASPATNAVTDVLVLKSQSSGTPAAGIGTGISFAIETSAANVETGARMEAVVTDGASTNEDIDIVFYTMLSGDTATEALRIHDDGDLTVAGGLTLGDALTISNGGTGATSLTDGGVLLGSGTGAITAMSVLADGAIVIGDGSGDPVALSAFSSSTGALKVANGGTGATTLNNLIGMAELAGIARGNIIVGDSSGNPALLAAGTEDYVLTMDSNGDAVWAASASGGMTAFILEDDDGTEISISNAEEVKFIGAGITTNWTDTTPGSDGDPFDLTFTIDAAQTLITSLFATDIKIGEDDQTKIDFETANQINFYADNTKRVTIDSTGLTVNSGSLETATIDYTDGDNAITINDGGSITLAKAVKGAIVLATEDATVVIDLSTSNYFEITLGANVTDIDFTNGSVGQRFIIRFEQPSGANYTIVYSAVTHDLDGGGSPATVTVSWPGGTAPTMTATNDKADTYGFIVRAEGHFDGYVIGQNIAETTN
jgi:hypothetical protein